MCVADLQTIQSINTWHV